MVTVRINAQLLGGQLFFENTLGCPLDDGIIIFWYRVMPHESESYGHSGFSLQGLQQHPRTQT